MKHIIKILSFALLSIFLLPTACQDDQEAKSIGSTKDIGGINAASKTVILGETIEIKYWANADQAESAELQIDGNTVATHDDLTQGNFTFQWDTKGLEVGSHKIKLNIAYSGKTRTFEQVRYIYPRSAPKQKRIEIVQTYPHDTESYTQGLEFDGDKLYEGTGRNGFSNLREVDLNSGSVIRQKDLDQAYFGEGITIWGNNIYQITWRSRKGFVYDKETFDIKREFEFNNAHGEGWGLTHSETHLIMSDGSNQLYFLDTNTLSQKKTLEVYANSGSVSNLNELEYIDGRIYANVYGSNQIVVINEKNGVVEEVIDLSILRSKLGTSNVDVLNGIAYNKTSGKLYVTGKLWPKLFEINIIDN